MSANTLVEIAENDVEDGSEAEEEYDNIDDWEDPMPDISIEELREQAQSIEAENAALEHETKLYKQYMTDHMETNGEETVEDAIVEQASRRMTPGRSSGYRRRSNNPTQRGGTSRTAITTVTVVSLTIKQKLAIATRIKIDLRALLERNEAATEKKINGLRAELEEAYMVADETEARLGALEREVSAGNISGKDEFSAEKFVRFMEDTLKDRDLVTSKYRLKSSSLLAQKKTISNRLIQKEEAGDSLQRVDFEQLKIANHKYQETIEKRNEQMLDLKQSSGTVVSMLNKTKGSLAKYLAESERLQGEIKSRSSILHRLEKEEAAVEADRQEAMTVNKMLQKQLDSYEVPSVLQYVQQKASVEEQRKDVATWRRRVEVAENELKRLKSMWKSVTGTSIRT